MSNQFKELSQSARWALMVSAVVQGAEQAGWKMTRKPGRGMSNTWLMERDGKKLVAAIRTSQDRWLAFPPLEGGTTWKTLVASDAVLVGVVDEKDQPNAIQVYLFDAEDVRQRFDAAYKARASAGHVIKDDYGFWVNMEEDKRDLPMAVGSGLFSSYKPIATYSVADLVAANPGAQAAAVDAESAEDDSANAPAFATINDVMSWARDNISKLAAVPIESVKLDLKIQY